MYTCNIRHHSGDVLQKASFLGSPPLRAVCPGTSAASRFTSWFFKFTSTSRESTGDVRLRVGHR